MSTSPSYVRCTNTFCASTASGPRCLHPKMSPIHLGMRRRESVTGYSRVQQPLRAPPPPTCTSGQGTPDQPKETDMLRGAFDASRRLIVCPGKHHRVQVRPTSSSHANKETRKRTSRAGTDPKGWKMCSKDGHKSMLSWSCACCTRTNTQSHAPDMLTPGEISTSTILPRGHAARNPVSRLTRNLYELGTGQNLRP